MYLILVICINWCAVLVRETLFGFLYEWGTAIHLSGLCFNSLILLLFAPACTTRHNNHDQAGHKRNCDNNVAHLISLALGHCGPNKPSRAQQYFSGGKSLFYLLQLSPKFGFPPTTIKPGISPPSTFQTVHFTSLQQFWRLFATVTVVLSFSFLKKFQLNLWKIIVNHKKIIK